MRIYWLPFLLLIITSCADQKPSSILNTDALETQVYRIDNQKDTVLKTAKGAIIKISRGSFSNANGDVELEVKEAYSMEDIIKAGLTTQTNGKPLRSGGMIYLNAKDDNISINKPVQISVPSDSYDEQMKVYKGEMEDGKMNWTEPEPMKDSVSPYLVKGKQLFDAICATCHALEKNLTGPALRGTEARGPWRDRSLLFDFTRNSGAFIPKTCYTQTLAAQYNGQIMPSFPQLDDEALKAIYDFIKADDLKQGIDFSASYVKDPCDDSCFRYDSIRWVVQSRLIALHDERETLINGNENRINHERWNSTGTEILAGNELGTEVKELVHPEEFKAIYYRFDIDSFGWYNIDALLQTAPEEAGKLSVQVDNSVSDKWDLFIAVPDQKVFDRGGKLANGSDYGFFTLDGKIPLKAGTKIIVFALGEAEGQIAFDYKEFTTTGNDVIRLQPKLVGKEEFNRQVKSWSMDKVTIEAADSKNATEIRKTDREIKSQESVIEQYRPKSCDCNCGLSADSTQQKETIVN